MSTYKDIICKFTLSCGNFGIHGKTDPNIFAAFWGISIDVKIGSITNDIVYSDNITQKYILDTFYDYLKEKCNFSEPLKEQIPNLIRKLHFHNEINEEFIALVAIQNVNNIIPVFYICDHGH
jgi:hypothetical protein